MTEPVYREVTDYFGTMEIPESALYGIQTARSVINFPIGNEQFTRPFIRALGLIKKVAAQVNLEHGKLSPEYAAAIIEAAEEVIDGKHDDHFPLVVWQTGSGTQTNMNANEVITNRANMLLGYPLDTSGPIHPNDHCNLSQSSNDTIPTAMHISAAMEIRNHLLPALKGLNSALHDKELSFSGLVKTGRTHLQDATPLTLGQEFSAFVNQVDYIMIKIAEGLSDIHELAQGGTAVGTGLNSSINFDADFANIVKEVTGFPFRTAINKFAVIGAHDTYVSLHGCLNTAAATLFKIANDIRLLASGPRTGLGELVLPANEPGSTIMPGKINPTQCEAITMVCAHIFGNHTTMTFAGSQGHLQLNAFKPLMAYTMLQSIQLLADAVQSFTDRCIKGIQVNADRMSENIEHSLMLVTALTSHIGYDKAAQIAQKAQAENISLKAAATRLGFVTEDNFDKWVRASDMTRPDDA